MLLAFVACVAVQSAPASAQGSLGKVQEWKLSTAVGPAFALGKAGERWAKLVTEESRGNLTVVQHPGAVLALRDPGREFIALRDGDADLAVGSTLFWSAQVRELGVVGLPWIAPGAKQVDALLAGEVGESLAAAIERAGAIALAFAPLGHRELATVGRAVRTPEDFAGLQVRIVSSPYLADLYAGLRARPRAMAFADAQAAFRSGALDAQEGAPAMFAAARVDALGVRHVTLWGAVAEIAVFAANRTTWDAATSEQRALVRDTALRAALELAALVRAENDAALAELQRRGMMIERLTPSGQAAFAAAARPIYDKWAAVAGDPLVRAAEATIRAASP